MGGNVVWLFFFFFFPSFSLGILLWAATGCTAVCLHLYEFLKENVVNPRSSHPQRKWQHLTHLGLRDRTQWWSAKCNTSCISRSAVIVQGIAGVIFFFFWRRRGSVSPLRAEDGLPRWTVSSDGLRSPVIVTADGLFTWCWRARGKATETPGLQPSTGFTL